MVDIFLELPDETIELFERRAKALGRTAEDLMREIIEASAPEEVVVRELSSDLLADEPIVKAAEIENEYRNLRYKLGWRFITCPQANADRAKLRLVSLNPAGRAKHGPAWSQEGGSAYREFVAGSGATPTSSPRTFWTSGLDGR